MQIPFTVKKAVPFLLMLVVCSVHAALVTRVTNFTDGSVLTAGDLNSEFNNLVDGVNNIDDDNISPTASIAASKVSAVIAGDGLSRNGTTGALAVAVDGSTLTTSSDTVLVKDNGVTLAKLAQLTALSVIGNATNATATPTAITAANDGEVLQRSGTSIGFGQILTAGLADGSVTPAKRSASVSAFGSDISASITTSYATVGSATITATGRPVVLMIVPSTGGFCQPIVTSSATGSGGYVDFQWLRGSTGLGEAWSGGATSGLSSSNAMRIACGDFLFVDVPSAGSVTYNFQIKRASGSASGSISGRVFVVEL